MEGVHALILILIQAPPALIKGEFKVDKKHSIYGFAAHIVGFLLIMLVVMAVADVCGLWGFMARTPWRVEYLLLRMGHFVGSILLVALIWILFREKHRG